MEKLKDILRKLFKYLHLDLTKNLEYDRLTELIMKQLIRKDSNCIDIGCHKGEILDIMLELAPEGNHLGFEPIPSLFDTLVKKYQGKATIFPYALSDAEGTADFQFVKNAPAYSGLKNRDYAVKNPEIDVITVAVKRLDDLLEESQRIDFIKIDVEGGEFGVLKGARSLLIKQKPNIVFECGIGASNYYGTQPEDIYNFLTKEIGLNISLLKSFVKGMTPLTAAMFVEVYNSKKEYYFIAHP